MERIFEGLQSKVMTAAQAAEIIQSGMTVATSGFTLVGDPKVIPAAVVELGKAGNLTVLTGASTGATMDGVLAEGGVVARRFPYQSNKTMRGNINSGTTAYSDIHLSHMPMLLNRGTGPHIDVAVIECCAALPEGLVPAATVGASDCFVKNADKIILEINTTLPMELCGMHDIFSAPLPGEPYVIPITDVADRIGSPCIPVDYGKVAAIVINDKEGNYPSFKAPDDVSAAIGEHIIKFLKDEVAAGRQPKNLNPIQSGVGSVANAVLAGLGNSGFTGMRMYTEVIQDSALNLIWEGKMTGASTTAVSVSREAAGLLYGNIDYFRDKIVIRPQEIANHPEVIRRLGVISMNTPIECDIYGNVNSTHVMGTKMMNGIGGSGDFARNAGITIFATESVAKKGNISCIVPMAAHVDHTEHDVDIIVTEQGLADLRWKSPKERAKLIIENCSHPDYRSMLREYFEDACRLGGHTPHDLSLALSWHERYNDTGSMK